MTPRWIEYCLLLFYVVLLFWHLWEGRYWKACYWFGAINVTAACIFGIKQ